MLKSSLFYLSARYEICQGRTGISIAHRLNYIKNADRILVLEDGQVTELGSHSELISKEETYAELWWQKIWRDIFKECYCHQ